MNPIGTIFTLGLGLPLAACGTAQTRPAGWSAGWSAATAR